ncbi:MAG: TonB-dependent receptor [Tannerellaceae bacterium]|nr:TonB-dependent receptor [Tannerellaceae bacterium]
MKMTTVLLLITVFQLQAVHSNAQNAKVDIPQNELSIEELIDAIEEQTSYLFLYNEKDINLKQQIHLKGKNKPVTDVLKEAFSETDIHYSFSENYISLRTGASMLPGPQQNRRQISGVVLDEEGFPVIGANIVEKGTTTGIITDIDGNFTLSVSDNAILIISFIGYEKQEVSVRNQTTLQIILKEDALTLEDVVVIGYGTQRKRDVAGSISSVSSKDLAIQSASNIQNLLQGRLSGVSVSPSGVPGEAPSIRVWGIGTMSNNQPLYVIDGFPTKSELASQINPSTIESVQVLKDASSASIYGAQAANGVILITTKQGKAGKAELDIKVNAGVQTASNLPKMLNSQQYGEVLWSAMKNAGLTPSHSQYGSGEYPVIPDYILPAGTFGEIDLSNYNQAENQYMRANKKGTNWTKEVYRPAQTTNIDLSARGGSTDSKYFMNANYFSQDAVIKWAGYDRFSMRGNSSFTILKNVVVGSNLSASYSKYKGGTSDMEAAFQAPLLPVYDVMGNWAGTKANGLGDSVNPVASLYNQKDNYRENLNILGNLFLEINFLNAFQFKTIAGANIENGSNKAFSPTTYWNKGDKNTLVNSLSLERGKVMELVWNNTLTYSTKFMNHHSIQALVGTEALTHKRETLKASRNNFLVEEVDYRYLDAGEASKDNAENGYEYALFSLFTRINYQYQDKYYISAILRRDGSSRFGQNNRYGYFPGVNAAWRISEEAFMSGQGMVSDLKLRASYGITGNQEIGNYAFTSMYYTNISTSSYPIAGDPNSVTQGISKETIGNSDIKWEKTTQANIGLDVGFLNNNLTFELDLYYKYTSDILQQVTYPATGGVASSPYENIGEMRNNGFEFNANYRKTTSKDFSFETGVILSGYRNKVKKLASDQFIASGDYNRTEVGRPISSFYGYIIDGIFQTQEEVDNHAD